MGRTANEIIDYLLGRIRVYGKAGMPTSEMVLEITRQEERILLDDMVLMGAVLPKDKDTPRRFAGVELRVVQEHN